MNVVHRLVLQLAMPGRADPRGVRRPDHRRPQKTVSYATVSAAPLPFSVFTFRCDTSKAWTAVTADDLADAYRILTGRGWTVEVKADRDRHLCPPCARAKVNGRGRLLPRRM